MTDPAEGILIITPSNNNELTHTTRSIYVGYGGNLNVLMVDGTSGIHYNVQDGEILPIRVKQVYTTGTTASGILGYY